MKIAIDKVRVSDRLRTNLGDLSELMESIRKRGLLHPIVIDLGDNLIAGERRLESCKLLGWTQIDATRISLAGDGALLAQSEENVLRKAFTPSERYKIAMKIEPILAGAASRKKKAGKAGAGGRRTGRETRAKIAAAVGTSKETLRKIVAVMEAYEADPKTYQAVVDRMDSTGNVSEAFRELKDRNRRKRIKRQSDKVREAKRTLRDHRLYRANHFSFLDNGAADLILTDPPYNISRPRTVEFSSGRMPMNHDYGKWDWTPPAAYIERLQRWSDRFYRVLRDGGSLYVFAAEHSVSFFRASLITSGFTFKNTLVWFRPNPKPKPDKTSYVAACDFILFAVKGVGHTFNYTAHGEMLSMINMPPCSGTERSKWGHPTQKPVALIQQLIEASSDPGETVLDPFAGSGTVGEACERTGRRFILIESEAKYIEMIEARTGISHEYKKTLPKVH